jgi:hypothetical protein
MKKHPHFFSKAVQPLLLFGLAATLCFAQASPFGQVAQGVSVEVVAIVKWVGIIIAVVVGSVWPAAARTAHTWAPRLPGC